jgi:hypothetical protein
MLELHSNMTAVTTGYPAASTRQRLLRSRRPRQVQQMVAALALAVPNSNVVVSDPIIFLSLDDHFSVSPQRCAVSFFV